MRTQKSLASILVIFLFLSCTQFACYTTKKSALPCPEFSVKKNSKKLVHLKDLRKKALFAQNRNKVIGPINRLKKNSDNRTKTINHLVDFPVPNNYLPNLSMFDYNKGLMASIDNILYPNNKDVAFFTLKKINIPTKLEIAPLLQQTKCDTIILKSGSKLIGKIEEIGQNEIKYRKCDYLTGPIISILLSNVSKISYSNGTSDLFGPTEISISSYFNSPPPIINRMPTAKTEGLGLAGFISSIIGLFIASIPLGLIAIIFGSISISKIRKRPERFKGKWFAILSIIIGLIDVVAMIALLAS